MKGWDRRIKVKGKRIMVQGFEFTVKV